MSAEVSSLSTAVVREGKDGTAGPHSESSPTGSKEEEEGEEEEENSLVEVYSDRLCAVMHAFALCCSVLQKSSGRSV